MNTMEINNIAVPAEDIEPMTFKRVTQQSATAPPQALPKSKRDAGVRFVMLVVIVLSLGSLGLYVQSSINQINSEIQQIYGHLVTEGSLGPD